MKRSNYTFVWANHHPLWIMQANLLAIKNLRDNPWNKIDNIICVSRDNQFSTFHSTADLQRDVERGGVFLEKAKADSFFHQVQNIQKNTLSVFQKLKTAPLSTLSLNELHDLFLLATKTWSEAISYFRGNQAQGVQLLMEALQQEFSEEELALLLTPSLGDVFIDEQREWQDLVKNGGNFLSHVKKYPWLVAGHFSQEEVEETISQKYKYDQIHLIFLNVIEEKAKLLQEQQKIIGKHSEWEEKVATAQMLSLSRGIIKSCWAGLDYYLIPLFQEIAKRLREPLESFHPFYLIEDFQAALLERKHLSAEERSRRKQCFVGLWKDKTLQFYSGKKAEEIAQKELGDLYQKPVQQEITGTIANKGKVRGIVRILNSNNLAQMRKLRTDFQRGEILITEMTQPNIMDIASKAGAIVTDEGGLLSHAAVISREFMIPCIVGTHFATKNFQDGDLVEVDAEKGVVRKIG